MEYLILLAGAIVWCGVFYFLMRALQRRRASRGASAATLEMRPGSLICACEEWRKERARFRPGDPRRLCAHLCSRLAEDIPHLPEALRPFLHLVTLMAEEGRGVPYAPPTFAFVLGNSGYLATLEKDAYPTVTIYIGRKKYFFNVVEGSWKDGETPPFAADIGSLIQTEIRRRLARAREDGHAPETSAT